ALLTNSLTIRSAMMYEGQKHPAPWLVTSHNPTKPFHIIEETPRCRQSHVRPSVVEDWPLAMLSRWDDRRHLGA
ncbi:MAG TPA: hypothetical protein VHN13_08220, partial [Candidatus Tectomicrobia bacterium]|nr:hypothetical protein [Candidatus Tectomicrobia bacterium]